MEEDKGTKAVKSGIWYTVSEVAMRATGILTGIIYTYMLTEADFGVANTFNSWIVIFSAVAGLCLTYSIGRAKLDFGNEFDGFISSIQTLSSGFALIIFIFAFIFRKSISGLLGYETSLIMLMFLYLIIAPSVDYIRYKFRFEYKYKENIAISIFSFIGTVVFSIVLMLVFNQKRYFGKIWGTVLPTLLIGIFFYIKIIKEGKVLYNKKYWSYALKIGLPMIPHGLAMLLLAQVDRIMIRDMCGDSASGIYIWGYTIATLLQIVTNAIGQAWHPWFNEQLFEGNKEGVSKISNKLMQLGCFLTICFIIVGPEITMLLSIKSPGYWVAKWVIPAVAAGTLCQYFYQNYVNIEVLYKKTSLIAISTIAATALNYGLNLLCIPLFGYQAAAYTTLAGYLFLMIFHFVATRYVLKIKVYNDRYHFALLFGTCIFGMTILAVYDKIIIRYVILLAFMGMMAYVKRKDLAILTGYARTKYLNK